MGLSPSFCFLLFPTFLLRCLPPLFIARRVRPSLSLVNHEVRCVYSRSFFSIISLSIPRYVRSEKTHSRRCTYFPKTKNNIISRRSPVVVCRKLVTFISYGYTPCCGMGQVRWSMEIQSTEPRRETLVAVITGEEVGAEVFREAVRFPASSPRRSRVVSHLIAPL